MSEQAFRNASGGRIDRSRRLTFRFGGRSLTGYPGDTLASALVANGVRLAGRSFKYHRPRGLLAAGVEEPNILVQVGRGALSTPNVRATEVALCEGLETSPVNCWPSARFDIGGVNDLLSRFLPAGFYYKTFMWPSWHLYEWAIRRAAGLGRAASAPDPDRYETRYAHCDVLIVGGGPAGLAAARAAAAGGARVILAEQDFELGGSLLWRNASIEGLAGADWAAKVEAELQSLPEVRILTRTTATGYYDHNEVSLLERSKDDLGLVAVSGTRQRLWEVRAKHVILATGAIERPLVFAGNDRPGVMLASAAQHYLRRYAARPGKSAVVFTNNNSAYETAHALAAGGIPVEMVIDTRAIVADELTDALRAAGIASVAGGAIVSTVGRAALRRIRIRENSGRERQIACDLLAMSGGWNPTVHLFSQSGGRLDYDAKRGLFRPGTSVQAEVSVGAANGTLSVARAIAEGAAAGSEAAGLASPVSSFADQEDESRELTIEPVWAVEGKGKAFVDFQNDVTVDDIALAARENFRSIEHLKRYTTLGMAPDQGKTANVNAIGIMAALTDQDLPAVGTTRYRPPFTPIALGAFGGRMRGDLFKPIKRSPLHDWHEAHGAVLEDFGPWRRPAYYAQAGESRKAAMRREICAVRERAGLIDYSPLGKIEIHGPDAALFLDRIYANTMSTLKPSRLRYGLMLDELGVVIDDGIVARLSADRFWLTTTSGGADRIAAWLEEWLQCEWRELRVLVTPVTTAWATLLISGPAARAVLRAAGTDIDLDGSAFPHMSMRDGQVAGEQARVLRTSYSGEVSYEINVPARSATNVWQLLLSAGEPLGIEPFGMEAILELRAEKGFIHIGSDTDGTTIPDDIGWGHVLKRNADFIGKRSLLQPENLRRDRLQLVGLLPARPNFVPAVGDHLRGPNAGAAIKSEGYVTASGHGPTLGHTFALGMVRAGRSRLGEEVTLLESGERLRIVSPVFYDPAGERLGA